MSTDVAANMAPPAEEPQLLPTEDQMALGVVLRQFFEKRSPESVVRAEMDTESGFDQPTWAAMGDELGVCGLAVSDSLGGAACGFVEVAVVLEELGRSLACVPFFSSVVLAQSLLLAIGDPDAMGEWLPDLASGSRRATVAFAEPGAAWDVAGVSMRATQGSTGWRLSGIKSYVIDGQTAEVVFVVARTGGGLSVFAVDAHDPGLTRRPLPTMDLTRKQARLEFRGVPGRLVGPVDEAQTAFETMLQLAAVGLSAESVGLAQRVLDMSVGYAKIRHQFGRAIGSFQAIKHKCADMLLAVESARSAAYYARVVAAADQRDQLAIAAAMAKSFCTDAAVMCAAENIQIHGGIGFTWEHPAHLYFKRAKANQLMFGDPILHRSRLAELLNL